MTTNFNECLYLNAEKDNAGSMLKKCINGSDELAWPCTSQKHIDTSILSRVTERPNADNIQGNLYHSLNPQPVVKNDRTKENGTTIEGFTNMGKHYIRPGDCPDGYYLCPKTNRCKQICMNCKYNERTYGKTKQFNEASPCFPDKGVYDGIDSEGNTICSCGKNNQYCDLDNIEESVNEEESVNVDNKGNTLLFCGDNKECNEIFDAQGGMLYDNVYIMNVGDYGALGELAAY